MSLTRYCLALLLTFVGLPQAFAQSATMKIHLKDGSERVIAIDSVKQMDMLSKGSEYFMMKIHLDWESQPEWYGLHDTRNKLYPKFARDASGDRFILVGSLADYRILAPKGKYQQGEAPVDSITFTPFRQDTNIHQFYWNIALAKYVSTRTSIWSGNTVYAGAPVSAIPVEADGSFPEDGFLLVDTTAIFISFNSTLRKILYVASESFDHSLGGLWEYDLESQLTKPIDTARKISSAHYLSNDKVVYYDYGAYKAGVNETPEDAGYYSFNTSTKERRLLYKYISELGPSEGINGFDVSPDGSRLAIPLVRYSQPPLIVEYDLNAQRADTIPVEFENSQGRDCLWLRYNASGNKLLYSNFPAGIIANGFSDKESELGVIDLRKLSKQVIPVVPDSFSRWIALFPDWSADERFITFVASPIAVDPPNWVGSFRLCTLKLP